MRNITLPNVLCVCKKNKARNFKRIKEITLKFSERVKKDLEIKLLKVPKFFRQPLKILLKKMNLINDEKIIPRSWYKKYTPLTKWLNGQETLKSYVDGTRLFLSQEYGGWVALDKIVEVHKSYELDAQSLEESWDKTERYIKEALTLVQTCENETPEELEIEHEDRGDILYKLGDPPGACYPLYMFTVESKRGEELVYVGLTNSGESRFKSGHRACTKLLDPKYDNCKKRLYLCHVMLLSKDGDYLPLEWVSSYSLAEQLLDDFESQLIFNFQPIFNDKKKTTKCAKNFISMSIVNYTGETKFLHECQI